MAKKSTALAVVEAPRETLHQIETELRELCELRDDVNAELEPEAAKAIDDQIADFVGREIRKVTSIAALLRYFRSQVAAATAEEEHARRWRDRWDGRYKRLAGMVHGVMVAMDVQKLEGATDRFRRQNNPQALEVVDTAAIPDEYMKATIRLPFTVWKDIVLAVKAEELAQMVVTSDVDAVALKKALQSTVDCHYCEGFGQKASEDGKRVENCQNCQGAGQVPKTVPGARLSRGEHLRVE